MLTRVQARPFTWVAWLGVVTTALNTLVPVVSGMTAYDLDVFRDIVLLVHAPATLLPLVGLSLLAFHRAPFAAVVVVCFTLLEKSLEIAGQALQLFPPEEMVGGAQAQEIVAAVWDQMFFVLWLCNTLGATAAGVLMFRVARPPLSYAAASFAWAAALLTLMMLVGPDYLGWNVPSPNAVVFFAIFTGYRTMVALTLARSIAPSQPLTATSGR